jgi:outer membrane protein insertion porin family
LSDHTFHSWFIARTEIKVTGRAEVFSDQPEVAAMTERLLLLFLRVAAPGKIPVVLLILFSSLSAALAQQRAAEPDVLIEDIIIEGNRRIPRESVLYYMQSRAGVRYSPEQVRRDVESLLATGWFDPVQTKIITQPGERGGVVLIIRVAEFPIIRELGFRGLQSATESEIISLFNERRTGISQEARLDPAKVNRACQLLRELLTEKGHPEADVTIEIEEITPTTVSLIFVVDEGPRVRVKSIEFIGVGNKFSQRRLRNAMTLVKEAGLFSSFTSKDIYSKARLDEDLQRVRFYLGTLGYLQAVIGEPKIERAGQVTTGLPVPVPVFRREGPGIRITVPIEVGRRYRIASVIEQGVTIFPPGLITAAAGLKQGEIISARAIQEGVYRNIRDLYGERGFINAEVEFTPKYIDRTADEGEVEVTLEVDEGRQVTLRRLEFIGNNVTRDVVLRREVLLNENDPYNKRLWDLSLLRLNQLGLFEEIRDRDATTRTNMQAQTVEIDLHLRERGRQSFNVSGGAGGQLGSYGSISYATNNLLGYGESLSFELSLGDRWKSFSFGFGEPYLLGRPISLNLQLFAQRYQFIGDGFNPASAGQPGGEFNTLFAQSTVGGAISLSAPLSFIAPRFRRYGHFTRLGLSYSYTSNSVTDPTDTSSSDPALSYAQRGIRASRLTPSLFFSTLQGGPDPTRGQSLAFGVSLAGGILGGDVRTIAPNIEYKFFAPVFRLSPERQHVIGMRFRAQHIRSFGAALAPGSLAYIGGIPIYERFFLGSEDTIRGYNVRSISPAVVYDSFLSTRNVKAKIPNPRKPGELTDAPGGIVHPSAVRAFTLEAPEGECTFRRDAECNVFRRLSRHRAIGGDTELLYNIEYRVPIKGPLSVAAFADIGAVMNLRRYQDQVVTSDFTRRLITPDGVILNPAGRVATADELANSRNYPGHPASPPPGFHRVYMEGEARSYNIARLSQQHLRFLSELRSSLGMEVRVQMPMFNVPLRMIMYYNPNARTNLNDPTVIAVERRTGIRFSIGRTF